MNTEEFFTYIQSINDLFDVSRSLHNKEFLATLAQKTEYRRQVLDDFDKLDDARKIRILEGLKNFLPLAWELYASLFNLIKEDDRLKKSVIQGIETVAVNLSYTVGDDFFEHELKDTDRKLLDLEKSIRDLEDDKLRRIEFFAAQRLKKDTLDKETCAMKADMSELKGELGDKKSEYDRVNAEIVALRKQIASVDTGAKKAEHDSNKLAKELEIAQNRYQKAEVQTRKLLEKKLNLKNEEETLKDIQGQLKRNTEYCNYLQQKANHMQDNEIHSRLTNVREELVSLNEKIKIHGGLKDREFNILQIAKDKQNKR